MNPTRRARTVLAGPRRGFASLLTAVLLVLTLVSASALGGSHRDGFPHGGPQAADGGGRLVTQTEGTDAPAAGTAAGPVGAGRPDCPDRHSPLAQCDPLPLASSPGPAAAPAPTVSRFAPVAVPEDVPAPANTAEATAPSLHALGISRT